MINKEDLKFLAGGLILGLVLGFFVANWIPIHPAKEPDTAASKMPGGQPDISSGKLPPGHPDISSGAMPETGKLPPGHPDIPSGGSEGMPDVSSGSSPVAMPSLDPIPAGSKEKKVEQQFKNIKVLKGLPVDRFQELMKSFNAMLGVDCSYCHAGQQWDKEDKKAKESARKDIELTRELASKYQHGGGRISCYTCHRGHPKPPA